MSIKKLRPETDSGNYEIAWETEQCSDSDELWRVMFWRWFPCRPEVKFRITNWFTSQDAADHHAKRLLEREECCELISIHHFVREQTHDR